MADAAARKALERERKRAQGLVEYKVWIPNTKSARLALAQKAAELRASASPSASAPSPSGS